MERWRDGEMEREREERERDGDCVTAQVSPGWSLVCRAARVYNQAMAIGVMEGTL